MRKRTLWNVRRTKIRNLRWSSFVVHVKKLCILGKPKCVHWRFWSVCADWSESSLNDRSEGFWRYGPLLLYRSPWWYRTDFDAYLLYECNRWKNGNNIFPDRGSNPVRRTQSPTLYHVAIKAGLYRKAVQVSYILIPGDILPLQIEIRPWISRSPRITWNETQGVLSTHVGYLRWAPNVTGEKNVNDIFPDRESNPVRCTQSPTLYHVAIKAGLYRKAIQVSYILIPGDTRFKSRYRK